MITVETKVMHGDTLLISTMLPFRPVKSTDVHDLKGRTVEKVTAYDTKIVILTLDGMTIEVQTC